MKKWQWAVLAIAFLLMLYVFFKSSREGFEDFKCPAGSTFSGETLGCTKPSSDLPTCPSGFKDNSDGYCIKQYPDHAEKMLKSKCPDGQVFGLGKCNTSTPAKCPRSKTLVFVPSNGSAKCVQADIELYLVNTPTSTPVPGSAPSTLCKSGDLIVRIVDALTGRLAEVKCLMKNPATAPSIPGSGGNAVMTGNTTGGSSDTSLGSGGNAVMTGNTTGGSSDTSLGSTAGGGGYRRKQIFGPLFTSRGEGAGSGSSGNSTKDNVYPELLGGGFPKNSDTSGLPSSAGLGSDEASKYFPTSRVPGDMDLIPDPYRVSQSFSASNYSVKNEPVPFLTDFSAFQK
jgi:hypothetical protein